MSYFLWASGALFALVFALPLFFAPLSWARRFLWVPPRETDLTVYFGRCLGAVAIALVIQMLRAAPDPASHRWVFELLAAAGVPLSLVHVWGAIRRAQPWTETVELALYSGMVAISLGCLRALG